jgi:hypothetical protein
MPCNFCRAEEAFATWFPGPETFYANKGSAYDCADISVVCKDHLRLRWPAVNLLKPQTICDACLEVAVDIQAVQIE